MAMDTLYPYIVTFIIYVDDYVCVLLIPSLFLYFVSMLDSINSFLYSSLSIIPTVSVPLAVELNLNSSACTLIIHGVCPVCVPFLGTPPPGMPPMSVYGPNLHTCSNQFFTGR